MGLDANSEEVIDDQAFEDRAVGKKATSPKLTVWLQQAKVLKEAAMGTGCDFNS